VPHGEPFTRASNLRSCDRKRACYGSRVAALTCLELGRQPASRHELVAGGGVTQEIAAPRTTEAPVSGRRAEVSLDGEWGFVADPERIYRPDALPEGDRIQVPGPWEAQVPRPYRIITAWYRRPVDVPSGWRGLRVVVRFGAVMYRCAVFLNGTPIGDHEGGYLPFEVDATDVVRWGETNDLAVLVVNPLNAIDEYPAFSVEDVLLAEEFEPDLPLSEAPHGKQTWYSSTSGIWQSVTLEARPMTALAPLRVRPDLETSQAIVHWSIDGEPADPTGLELVVRDPHGNEVGRERAERGGDIDGVISLPIPDPVLWDIDQPNLYTVEARLLDGEDELDRVTARFGMRSVTTQDGRICLNGRPIYVLGALDQDHYPDTIATPPSREYLDRQVRLAREMGINLLRCHIKVPDPRYLDAADEAGILVWCELPNWSRFTSTAAGRGRRTLERMIEELGNHPSVAIWTIVNEDWGTQLRYEARDRHWLRDTYHWVKTLDPSRLVVDNSACDTPQTPNFHVATDIADFHVYFVAPDNAIRWRNTIEDFARRPRWLWSPHGDAQEQGDEPLVLSEFGSWGLPRLDPLFAHSDREPWWFSTGRAYYRPTGIARRFRTYGLDRIWPSLDELATATQWHQFEGLQYEIGQMRRHDSVQGYVITELTDAYWEANGVLDVLREPKVYHDRLAEVNSPDVVVADPVRRDLVGGGRLSAEVHLSSYGPRAARGRVEWDFELSDGRRLSGHLGVDEWPAAGASLVGSVDAPVPDVAQVCDAQLRLRAYDDAGRERARQELRFAVLPAARQRTANRLNLRVVDPLDVWGVTERVERLGHTTDEREPADLIVATELTDDIMDRVDVGGRALILVRDRAAIPAGHDLARRVSVHLRRLPHSGWPGQRSPWEGDWVTSWSWLLHDALPGLPDRNPLDFAYEEVLPDHVLLGYEPRRHLDEVAAGMFVGWVHAPAAIVWTFGQGRGAVTLTTFRLAPESGPVATALLEGLLQQAAHADGGPKRR
jgi:hypothetical protein